MCVCVCHLISLWFKTIRNDNVEYTMSWSMFECSFLPSEISRKPRPTRRQKEQRCPHRAACLSNQCASAFPSSCRRLSKNVPNRYPKYPANWAWETPHEEEPHAPVCRQITSERRLMLRLTFHLTVKQNISRHIWFVKGKQNSLFSHARGASVEEQKRRGEAAIQFRQINRVQSRRRGFQ